MKKIILALLLFICCLNCFSQEEKLRIVNLDSGQEVVLKEKRRIKVITKNGEKFAGRFNILNQNSIVVGDVILDLKEIGIIRKHPLLNTIMVKVNFLHIGGLAFFIAMVSGQLPVLLAGAAILASGVYGAVKAPNISKGYKVAKNWNFEIILE